MQRPGQESAEIDRYVYDLDPEQIAQHPAEPRDRARLLDARHTGPMVDHVVADLHTLLEPGDVVVVNNTRVRRARLLLRKATGGTAEVVLVEPTGHPSEWLALARPARRLPVGTVLYEHARPVVEIIGVLADGRRRVRVLDDAHVESAGVVPLPPYIKVEPTDPERYQTVYAERPGSVAAPTAGLHFTTALLGRLDRRGIERVAVDLEVGLGTFSPVATARLDDHVMHAERYRVAEAVWARITSAERVVAIGTTVVRTLETVARSGRLSGATDLFIRPGFEWRVVDVLMTNFHMPRSTLLVLVEAFVGPRWRSIYSEALARGYRVGSFGDAMLLARADLPRT